MAVKWTDEQKRVIDTRGKNILVSAAAGSGKTAVLSERVIKKCTEGDHPVDVDRILVLTFTRAAAAEMKERIYKKFSALSAENPSDRNIRRQLTLIHNAKITTIDSFCVYVYRNYFEDIDADPDLRLMDEAEGGTIRDKVLADLLEEKFEEGRPEFLALCDFFSAKDKSGSLEGALISLLNSLTSVPWPDRYLDSLLSPYACEDVGDLLGSPDFSFLTEYIIHFFEDLGKQFERLAAFYPEDDRSYGDYFRREASAYAAIAEKRTYPELVDAISAYRDAAGKLPTKKKENRDETDNYALEVRDKLKKKRDDFVKKYCAVRPETVLENLKTAEPLARELVALAKEFYHAFLAAKLEQGVMDFSDCEHMALSILVDEESGEKKSAAKELSSWFEEIMVDEYQDSNELQETILKSIVSEGKTHGNYFMVGDVKQSIYRFRAADPEIFAGKLYSFSEDADARDLLIRLDKNFRSREAVISSVNSIFKTCMLPDVGGVDYSEAESLKAGAAFPADGPENRTEIELAILPDKGEGREDLDDNLDVEAALLTQRISELMASFQVYDMEAKARRPLRYSDIAILTRSTSATYPVISRAFERAGIPFLMVEKENYLESYEVSVITSLLTLIDNPRNDLALTAVLKSPIVGLSDEKLLCVRNENGEGFFFSAVRAYADAHPEDEKLTAFYTCLGDLRNRASYTPIHVLLSDIYRETGFLDLMTAMPGGEVRRENLLRLFDLAVAYEKNAMKGIFGFLRMVEKQKEYTVSGGGGVASEADAVRFMTIHKSKGLEFPVVFLFASAKGFIRENGKDNIYLEKGHGLYMAAFDAGRRIMSPQTSAEIAKLRETGRGLGENLRVLYVALTRAKEKLIITGTVGNEEESEAALAQARAEILPLSYTCRMQAASMFDYILPAAAQTPGLFDIRILGLPDAAAMEEEENENRTARKKDLEGAEAEFAASSTGQKRLQKLTQYLSFQYPYADSIVYKTKYSVSEIKDKGFQAELSDGASLFPAEKEEEHILPKFLGGKEESPRGAERGSAMHRFLECFDFSADDFAERYAAEKERMLSGRLLTEEEGAMLDERALRLFLKSPVAARMHAAAVSGNLFREKAFVMEKRASEILPEGTEDKVLVQGIIDAYFFEGNDIILLDYKTDRVRDPEVLKKRYASQLDLYGEALARNYGKACREKFIYSLTLSQEIIL